MYEEKEQSIGEETLREIERRVMLSVIDQHWREHLYEMDYLQEGINLRAMGQQDPLVEWQREGFDMFEAMMGQIEEDFVRYVFHLQVVVDEEPRRPVRNVRYSAPEDPVQGAAGHREHAGRRPARGPARHGRRRPPAPPRRRPFDRQRPEHGTVRSRSGSRRRPGRNEPCFCGSGKKYKLCHGR